VFVLVLVVAPDRKSPNEYRIAEGGPAHEILDLRLEST
jgi:hypothetical protein